VLYFGVWYELGSLISVKVSKKLVALRYWYGIWQRERAARR